jgi:cytosine/adenosine deaminase-related metal-dependent hydrolase
MTAVDAFDDSFVACSDLVTAGVTAAQVYFHTFADRDQYFEALEQVLSGINQSGIRALVILGITDQAEFLPTRINDYSLLPDWLPPKSNISFEDYSSILEQARKQFPELNFGIGPIGAQWCSDKLLSQLGELAQDGSRVHSHLLESPRQRNWAGENPLDRLTRHGLLGPKTSLAHGVWCHEGDLAKIKDAGAQLVTCPGSNAALKAGTADLNLWQESQVKFGFGLDSAADPVKPWKIAHSAMNQETALRTLTAGGISCTDLPANQDEVVWRDFDAGIVDVVSIGGRVLVQEGKALNHDSVEKARERIQDALAKDQENRVRRNQLISSLLPRYQKALDQ